MNDEEKIKFFEIELKVNQENMYKYMNAYHDHRAGILKILDSLRNQGDK